MIVSAAICPSPMNKKHQSPSSVGKQLCSLLSSRFDSDTVRVLKGVELCCDLFLVFVVVGGVVVLEAQSLAMGWIPVNGGKGRFLEMI